MKHRKQKQAKDTPVSGPSADTRFNTPNKRKKYIESEIEKLKKITRDVDPDLNLCLDGFVGAKRKKTLLQFLDKAEEEFGSLGLKSVVESVVLNEMKPLNTYNHLDYNSELQIGAALWILSRIRACGKMHEAYKILPDTAGDADALYLPLDFSHPCFSSDLINAVLHLIIRRYPEHNVMTEANAQGIPPADQYLALLKLIPEEDIQSACTHFREKLKELLTMKMKGNAWFDKEIEKLSLQLKNAKESLLSDKAAFQPPKGFPGMPGAFDTLPDISRISDIAEQIDDLDHARTVYEATFRLLITMDRKTAARESGSREIARILDGFTVQDPYELCFAMFYLIDSGDDMAWLVGSGSTLMEYVEQMLPWYVDENEEDDFDWDEWYGGMEYNKNGWLDRPAPPEQLDYYHEKHNGLNYAQIIYRLCRGVVPVGLHPFEADRERLVSEGMEEAAARRITDTAEMIFLHTFQARQFSLDDWNFDFEEEEPFEENPAQTPAKENVPASLGGYWGKVAAAQNREAAASDGPVEEDTSKLKAELEQAKKQIKSLKTALSTEKHAADADRAKYEKELKSLRMEHRELADLRTLVFNRENEIREVPVKNYTYPYETKKRTVVFGGHETFLKAIRPMLPNVKFVDARNLTFSPEIIRNADVVWIQNNCISHSQYWNIVKNCKTAGVQMRYFGFASAEKCAEQLVEWDQNP
ncbi:MAG: hypothetical protein IKD69_06070 [Solobacterium sp.]|nr:hypothetical protein [Solobacterium sp.]